MKILVFRRQRRNFPQNQFWGVKKSSRWNFDLIQKLSGGDYHIEAGGIDTEGLEVIKGSKFEFSFQANIEKYKVFDTFGKILGN